MLQWVLVSFREAIHSAKKCVTLLCFWPTCSLISKLSCTFFLNMQILIRIFNRKWTFICNWCRMPRWQAHSSSLSVEISIPGILEVENELVTAIIFHLLQHNNGWSNSQLWTISRKEDNKICRSLIINKLLYMQTLLRNTFAIQLQFHSIYQWFVYHLIKEPVFTDLAYKKKTHSFWLILQQINSQKS